MAAEQLNFNTTTVKQAAGTDGINDWIEIPGNPHIEVFRVTSNESGDWVFCQRIHRIIGVAIQNHGADIGTGVRDPPAITITQGSATSCGKITITHTATQEVFSIMVIGEL